jgi:transglutaminase-like putative cysteine protease
MKLRLPQLRESEGPAIRGWPVYRLQICFLLCVALLALFLPFWFAALAGALTVWRWHLERTGAPLPSPKTRAWLALAFFAGVLFSVGTLWGRDAGTALMLSLTGLKFLETRTLRDHTVLICILIFLAATALLFEQSILLFIPVVFILGCILNAWIKLYSGAEEARATGWFATRLLLTSLPLALVLFFVFPRIQGQFGINFGLAKTGISSTIQPGSISKIVDSPATAFRVDLPGGQKIQPKDLYWRGIALTVYDAHTHAWTVDPAVELVFRQSPVGGESVVQRITVMPHAQKFLFALDYPNGAIEPKWIGRLREAQYLQSYRPVRRKLQYVVTSRVGSRLGEIGEKEFEYNQVIRSPQCLEAPAREFAKQLGAQSRNEEELISRVLDYFRAGGFVYSREPQQYKGKGLAEFLFERKTGFCEHYASALAVIMRVNGVPARVIAGYQGGDLNPYGNFYTVRQEHAHAWCEVYVRGKGWVRVDPTAVVSPTRLEQGAQVIREATRSTLNFSVAGAQFQWAYKDWLPQWWRRAWDELSLRWEQWEEKWDYYVLSYNPQSSYQMAWQANAQAFGGAGWLGPALLVLLAALAFAGWRQWRRQKPVADPLWEVYRQFCDELHARNLVREPWEGPLHFAARASGCFTQAASSINAFSYAWARARYGSESINDSILDSLKNLREQVAGDLPPRN